MWRLLKGIASTAARIDAALRNLIAHYRTSASVAFVEHFLALGVPMAPSIITFMRTMNVSARLCFFLYVDADHDGDITPGDIVKSLHIPLPAARSVLGRVLGVPLTVAALESKGGDGKSSLACSSLILGEDEMYARLATGSLPLKRLVVASTYRCFT
jgi:hypothetical protein